MKKSMNNRVATLNMYDEFMLLYYLLIKIKDKSTEKISKRLSDMNV
jgi:hypothetical protein